MQVLVTGASGYIGAALIPRLQRDGHQVRAFARDASRVAADVPIVTGDAISGRGLEAAMEGMECAYFLIHSMEAAADGAYIERDRSAAQAFASAARAAGVRHVVYLGGLIPAHAPPSPHLASRLEVEQILLDAAPAATALRASIVIGANSRSFRFLVRLIERMPVIAMPPWRARRTAPIDGRDVIEYLARAPLTAAAAGGSIDVAGPDNLSYAEIIERIGDGLLVGRPRIPIGLAISPIASRVAAAIAGEDPGLVEPLMGSLEHDLLPRDDSAIKLFGLRLHSFDAAVERSLRDWENVETLAAR